MITFGLIRIEFIICTFSHVAPAQVPIIHIPMQDILDKFHTHLFLFSSIIYLMCAKQQEWIDLLTNLKHETLSYYQIALLNKGVDLINIPGNAFPALHFNTAH